MPDRDSETQVLRRRLCELVGEARQNERLLQRFLERELLLLCTEGLGDLLAALSEGLRNSFGLEVVSLHLVDTGHRIRHLLAQGGLDPAMFPAVVFRDDISHMDPGVAGLRRPRLGSFREPQHRTLFPPGAAIRSLAIVPMIRGGLLGHINLGSSDPQRYTHHHASDFLHRLGVIAALCLENAVNRDQLVLSGYTDALTGLRNRRYLELRLQEELASAARYHHPLSCLFLDADYFKAINDRHGHAVGDAVLRELGACLEAQLRAADTATRYGGEELTVLLPRTGREEAVRLAERVRLAIGELRILGVGGVMVGLTVSIGVSTFEPRPASAGRGALDLEMLGRQLLEAADQALYRAKEQGRNRVVWNAQGVGDGAGLGVSRSWSRRP
jgi:diguanylate cyclase (GGDEF)-like protein